MSFTANEGEFISLTDATDWTKRYRDGSSYNGVKAQFYGKNKVADILQQQGCTGLRVYYGTDDQDVPVLILIGTNGDGDDLEDTELILERGVSCPPNCGGGGGSLQE